MPELDFSLVGQGPQFQNVLGAYQTGRQDAKKRNIESALASYDPSNPQSYQTTRSTLIKAGAMKEAADVTELHQQAQQEAAQAQEAQVAAQVSEAIHKNDFNAAYAMAANHPKLLEAVKGVEEHAQRVHSETAAILAPLLNMPPAARRAALMQQAPMLKRLGYDDATIATYPLDDTSIQGFVNTSIGVKGQMERADKERDFGLKAGAQEETGRHNRAAEGVAKGQLGVAQSNSARGWAAHNARLKAGGYGTPGVGGVIPDEQVEVDP